MLCDQGKCIYPVELLRVFVNIPGSKILFACLLILYGFFSSFFSGSEIFTKNHDSLTIRTFLVISCVHTGIHFPVV